MRETLPDDIGVSVSYPLPGTKFHAMVAARLGDKDRWDDSGDLAMMFEGTYQTSFYRELHKLLHRDLDLRLALANPATPTDESARLVELAGIEARLEELRRTEAHHRSLHPTAIEKDYAPLAAPDLSQAWN